MIDRKARDQLAELLHQFIAGRIENFDFENRVPNSNDPAIDEIWWNAAWPLYDDFKTHRLSEEWRIPNECRRELSKAVLFLKSNKEYIWPKETGLKPYSVSILSLLTFGIYKRWYKKKQSQGFNKEAWPFAYISELTEANNNPVYLNGKYV
jgi:hypothetical protein